MNPTTITPEIQAYNHQNGLVCDLKELYALVNVCRLAMHGHGQEETDSTSSVLMQVTNRLFELCEQEQAREKVLEAIAYPHRVGGDA